MKEDPKAVIRRFFEEVVNGRHLEMIDEIMTPEFVEHEEVPGLPPGPEGAKAFFAMTQTAFPDFRMDVEDVIAEGDKVVVRSRLRGTHKGEFMGVPATGKIVDVPVIDIVRIADGKVVEHWGVTDTAAMMEQLGAAPDA